MKIINSKKISLFALLSVVMTLSLSLILVSATDIKKTEMTLSYIKPTYANNAKEFKFSAEHDESGRRMASRVQNDNEFTVIPKSANTDSVTSHNPKLKQSNFPRENKIQNYQNTQISQNNQINQIATPVQIQSSENNSEAGFETPVIIPRKNKDSNIHSEPNVSPIKLRHQVPVENLKEELEKDMKTFMSQFDNSRDKQERSDVLKQGKIRINAQVLSLSNEIQDELNELLLAKEVALKLNNLTAQYYQKIKENKLSELKLSDSITIKKLLADKIQREIQGFRTNPSEYKELEIVNPSDVSKVIHEIRMKIGQ